MKDIEKTLGIYKARLERRRKALMKHLIDAENCQKSILWYETEIKRLETMIKHDSTNER